jgi:hypothetical protein
LQLPPLHVKPLPVSHGWLQSPQWALSLFRLRQMPSFAQSGRTSPQAHWLAVQTLNCAQAKLSVPPSTMPAVVQPPQLARSLVKSTQTPLQRVVLGGQAQVPALQVWPPLQDLSHAPQLALSVWVSTQEAPHFVRFASQPKCSQSVPR